MSFPERKQRLLKNFLEAFTSFNQVILVDLMNISTQQILKTRIALRERNGVVIIGKNSIAQLAIKILTEEVPSDASYYELSKLYEKQPNLLKLLPVVVGKIGFIFCDDSYVELKDIIENEKIKMAAKEGIVAPSTITLPVGPTHQDPGKIGEFQRVGVQVKAVKGSLEIVKEHTLCVAGEVVSATVSAMCRMLNIIPFEYAMELRYVLLGDTLIPKEIISLTNDDILDGFKEGVKQLTAVSLGAAIPNSLAVPHMIKDSFKMLMAIGMEADYKFKALEDAINQAANAPAEEEKKEEVAEEAAEEEEEEESDEEMDLGGMFG